MKTICPNCGNYVALEEHFYPDRTEYVCPKCGFVVYVFHKVSEKKPYPEINVWRI